ncbi:MAG: DUF58 domain-containing protein [Lachnospiraceae bacterium]|nr:DUF58 domain-containing protein [Lachnospiraceae bacterium]
MKNKIVYVLALIAVLYLTLLYNLDVMRFLLWFVLLLPIILEIWLTFVSRKIQIPKKKEEKILFQGESYEVKFPVENRSIFPISRIRLKLMIQETMTGNSQQGTMWITADGEKKNWIERSREGLHCGRYLWTMQEVRIYDYLGVFSRKEKRADSFLDVQIFPDIYQLQLDLSLDGRIQETEEAEYEENRPGDDVSEIFQIRPYRGGDALQRIHWKMTAKEDELMVKDYGAPKGAHLLLILDFFPEQELTEGCMDDYLSLAASLSYSLMTHGIVHEVLWRKDSEWSRIRVSEEKDTFEFLSGMLRTSFIKGNSMDTENLEWIYREGKHKLIYRLDQNLCLFQQDNLCMDFSKISKDDWDKQWIIL